MWIIKLWEQIKEWWQLVLFAIIAVIFFVAVTLSVVGEKIEQQHYEETSEILKILKK